MAILNDLPVWQKLNVSAFLASSVSIGISATHGQAFVTRNGTHYLPFIKHPVVVLGAESKDQLQRALKRARDRGLAIGIYTGALFHTRSEEGNLEEIRQSDDESLDLVGLIVYGENKKVDKAMEGLKFHV